MLKHLNTMNNVKFSILISTKNRKEELLLTLDNIDFIIQRNDVECVVFDDGSSDGTFQAVSSQFPNVKLFRNEKSRGYMFCRNFMLNNSNAMYAISLDDDAHFVSNHPLDYIENIFNQNLNCGLIAFRIFWGKQLPPILDSSDKSQRVKGFVGCGHVWRIDTWKKIPSYPEWFVFYGEEEFASYQLFKINQEIIYEPSILVHHRVDVISRKNQNDYQLRLRRSLRSGWYLYFLFYPWRKIPKKMAYTLWVQLKNKTFKGDYKASIAILQAIFDVLINLPKLLKNSNRLSLYELKKYESLTASKIFWKSNE